MYTKKTKIVATIGPATESEVMLEKVFKAGVNVVRLNFSHGDFVEHGNRITNTRKISEKMGMPIAILQDLSGPKIRIGDFYQERVKIKEGDKFMLTTEKVVGDEHKAYVNYEKLPAEVKKGGIIYLDDGKKKLEVVSTTKNEVHCIVRVGGELKGRRGVNVPGAYLSISSLTSKDKKDLEFGIEQGVDYMALSFVRRPEDVVELRNILNKKKAGSIQIISKVETQEAVDNLDEIIKVSDGIMVARGDLAIEIPAEYVPLIQKEIIRKCNKLGKPVITATQMLESMIHSPVPTRAEVSDVANAVLDGTDAVMLSEETTLGEYPVQAVETLKRVAIHMEKAYKHEEFLVREHLEKKDVPDAFSYAALNMAYEIEAKAIVALSTSGLTARMLSRHKPYAPLVVITDEDKTYNQLALSFGCYPVLSKHVGSMNELIKKAGEIVVADKLAKKGDTIIMVAGHTFGLAGSTNLLLAEKV